MERKLFDLSGKVAIVTGTSRGLGQYLGHALARAGADLVITSRDPTTLKPFQKEIEALGRKALPLALDVRSYESIQNMAQRAVDEKLSPRWQRRHHREKCRQKNYNCRVPCHV
jgi:NAD(P)-dependent dehydrogenase (short-subunit alcohol dehydrogenase family)